MFFLFIFNLVNKDKQLRNYVACIRSTSCDILAEDVHMQRLPTWQCWLLTLIWTLIRRRKDGPRCKLLRPVPLITGTTSVWRNVSTFVSRSHWRINGSWKHMIKLICKVGFRYHMIRTENINMSLISSLLAYFQTRYLPTDTVYQS